MNCRYHKTEMTKTDKKGKDYHWVEGKDKTMCYGDRVLDLNTHALVYLDVEKPSNDAPYEEKKAYLTDEYEDEGEVKTDSDKMSKEDWAAKDDKISRLTLAKQALYAGFSWQQAKEADIQKYYIWVKTGVDPDKVNSIKDDVDDILG